MGVLDAIGGGAIGALGSIASSAINYRSQQETNRLSEELSNTAVQRRVADMKAAGLNPVLAAGNPASQPPIAAPHVDDPSEAILGGAARAQAMATANEQQRLLRLQSERVEAETEGVHLDNSLKAGLLPSRTVQGQAEADYAVRTLDNRVEEQFHDTVIKQANQQMLEIEAEWKRQVANGTTDQYGGVNMTQLLADLMKGRQAAINQGIDQSKATVAAMAYAIQASKMNAQDLKALGVSPFLLDLFEKAVTTLSKAAGAF